MKKLALAAVFAVACAFSTATAWADRGHEHDGVNAETMSMLGLAAASIIGTGVYLVRRQKHRQ
jgi:uncharacterized membrane protein YoaK (UPF0700 family)